MSEEFVTPNQPNEARLPDVQTNERLAEVLLPDHAPDNLTEEEKAQIRAGIARGLTAAAEGRERPLAEWAANLRRDFNLPTHLTDSELATLH